MQHLANLLASPHPQVVLASLHTLTCFLKKTHYASLRWQGVRAVTSRLMQLAEGWGGRDEGLDMASLVIPDPALQVPSHLTHLTYEFYSTATTVPSEGEVPPLSPTGLLLSLPSSAAPVRVSITLKSAHKSDQGEDEVLAELVSKHSVPDEHRYEHNSIIHTFSFCLIFHPKHLTLAISCQVRPSRQAAPCKAHFDD